MLSNLGKDLRKERYSYFFREGLNWLEFFFLNRNGIVFVDNKYRIEFSLTVSSIVQELSRNTDKMISTTSQQLELKDLNTVNQTVTPNS